MILKRCLLFYFSGEKCYFTISFSFLLHLQLKLHIFMHSYVFPPKNSILISLECFSIGLSIVFLLISMGFLHIKDINSFLVVC